MDTVAYSEVNGTDAPDTAYKPSSAQVWGYGFLFVTIINMSAFAGVWVIPLMDKKMYKNVLMFLVSLAVGTLAGNALLCLIPESQAIFMHVEDAGMDYIWKNMVVLSGIYLFFNTERILKIVASRRRKNKGNKHLESLNESEETEQPEQPVIEQYKIRKRKMAAGAKLQRQQMRCDERARQNSGLEEPKQPSVQVTAMHHLDSNPDRIGYKFTSPTEAMAMTDAIEHSHEDQLAGKGREADKEAMEEGRVLLYSTPSECENKKPCQTSCASAIYLRNSENDTKPDGNLANHRGNGGKHNTQHGKPQSNGKPHGHSHAMYDGDNMIATVAYMIIFGDGLHNFIDGLAIGASFTNSVYQGISTSVAVICEEFPHELGDFAILLNSGMTVKQAVLANFLSALTCYLGLIIGIVLGESFHASEWIFALAGGMFLYISLVDMLPEINNVGGGDPLHEDQRSFKIFFIQNAGLLTGFGLMLVLSLFAEKIRV